MKHFIVAGLSLIPIVFYIVAVSTDSWALSSGIATLFSNTPYQFNYGLFRSTTVIGSGASQVTTKTNGCGSQTSTTVCDKGKTAEGFTVMALIIVSGALVLSAMNKGVLAAPVFAISGIFGMIGWALWYGGVQQSSEVKDQLTTFGSTDSGFSIGYSQALDIVAWTLSLLLAPLAFFTSERYVK